MDTEKSACRIDNSMTKLQAPAKSAVVLVARVGASFRTPRIVQTGTADGVRLH